MQSHHRARGLGCVRAHSERLSAAILVGTERYRVRPAPSATAHRERHCATWRRKAPPARPSACMRGRMRGCLRVRPSARAFVLVFVSVCVSACCCAVCARTCECVCDCLCVRVVVQVCSIAVADDSARATACEHACAQEDRVDIVRFSRTLMRSAAMTGRSSAVPPEHSHGRPTAPPPPAATSPSEPTRYSTSRHSRHYRHQTGRNGRERRCAAASPWGPHRRHGMLACSRSVVPVGRSPGRMWPKQR